MKIKLLIAVAVLSILFTSCKKNPSSSHPTEKSEQKRALPNSTFLQPNTEDSLDIKIGQMIMVGINDRKELNDTDTIKKELASNKIGGIIIFEKNISKTNSSETLKKLVANLQKSSPIPLLISIDEEGGKVHRLKEKYGFVKMPSAQYLGGLANLDSNLYYSKQLAAELSDLGITINFAPDVDLALNKENPIIAKVARSYSEYPDTVVSNALTFIKAHHQYDVKTTLKHFPGHGSSSTDTHKGLTDVTKQWQFKELIPFQKIIASGNCDAIVTSHIINCHLDTNCIASTLSKIVITDILRELLNFNGVVFSDDMQMYAISKNYGRENAVKMAINAGVDVLVFGNNVNLSDRITASELHAMIKKLVKTGEIKESRINESFNRISLLKKKRF